jgi:hypothetical protein
MRHDFGMDRRMAPMEPLLLAVHRSDLRSGAVADGRPLHLARPRVVVDARAEASLVWSEGGCSS